jgi:hypothetical protein
MALLKQVALCVLGFAILVGGLFVWSRLTERITRLLEQAWCQGAALDVCRFRGVWFVVIWAIVGLAILIPVGVFFEKLGHGLRKP